ncbi:MAG: ribbon-helix-helix protein, CopG family [Pseudohongiellaceae bacterium]
MSILTFRLENDIKNRLDAVVDKLGLNQSKIVREAVVAKLEELEELAALLDRVQANRSKKPIAELWKELGLESGDIRTGASGSANTDLQADR